MLSKQKTHRRASDQIRSLTRGGILDEQAFWQIVRAEKERADRSGLPVTVAVFTVKPDAKEFGTVAGWNAASLCQTLRETARITDHVGVAGANELGVLLWGTRELGAYRFVNRLGENAQWLAERCNLFVYPELKPTTLSGDEPSAEENEHSDRDGIPPGILKRIAEVERQLAKANAVETPTDTDQDFDDFGDRYSYGYTDETELLLDEIQRATESAPASAEQSKADTSEENAGDDDDDKNFPTGFQTPTPRGQETPPDFSATKSDDGGVALMTEPESKPSPPKAVAPEVAQPAPMKVSPDALKAAKKKAEQREIQQIQDSDLDVQLEPLENLFLHPFPRWKRAVDVVGAGVGLVLLSPLLLGLACLIKITSPGPVLFRQLREGYGGKLFMINKFRTMRVGADAEKAALKADSEQDGPAFKMANDPRITKLGSFLRKTCLDELPQLWNVLLGDMTLVGPRPLDHRESSRIARWGRRRLNVMPGLTCIWQVHGKSKVTFNEWMRMDIRYSQRVSFRQDMKLVFATLKQVVLRQASH